MKKRALSWMLMGVLVGCAEPSNAPPTTLQRTKSATLISDSLAEGENQTIGGDQPLHTASVPQLLRALEHPQQRVRLLAIKQLVARAEDSREATCRVMVPLAGLLKHADPWTRAASIAALGEIASSFAACGDGVVASEHPLLTDESLIEDLVAAIDDPVEGVREATPAELGRIVERSPELAEPVLDNLLPRLTNKQTGSRRAAARSIYLIAWSLTHAPQAPDRVEERLPQSIPWHRPTLLEAAIESLQALSADSDKKTRREAARALEAVERWQQLCVTTEASATVNRQK